MCLEPSQETSLCGRASGNHPSSDPRPNSLQAPGVWVVSRHGERQRGGRAWFCHQGRWAGFFAFSKPQPFPSRKWGHYLTPWDEVTESQDPGARIGLLGLPGGPTPGSGAEKSALVSLVSRGWQRRGNALAVWVGKGRWNQSPGHVCGRDTLATGRCVFLVPGLLWGEQEPGEDRDE